MLLNKRTPVLLLLLFAWPGAQVQLEELGQAFLDGVDIGNNIGVGFKFVSSMFKSAEDDKAVDKALDFWKQETNRWNAKIPSTPGYGWASRYGPMTEVLVVECEWEANVNGAWTKKKDVTYYANTMKWSKAYLNFGFEVRQINLAITTSENQQQAQNLVKAAGLSSKYVQAFSLNCQGSAKDIIETHVLEEYMVEGSGTQSRSLAWHALHQSLVHDVTDFAVSLTYTNLASLGGHESLHTGYHIGAFVKKHGPCRNMMATARITGDSWRLMADTPTSWF